MNCNIRIFQKALFGYTALLLLLLTEAVPSGSRRDASADEAAIDLPVYLHRPLKQKYCRFQAQLMQAMFAGPLVHPHGSSVPGHNGPEGGVSVSLCQPSDEPKVDFSPDWPLISTPPITTGCASIVSTSAGLNVSCKTHKELLLNTWLDSRSAEFRSKLEWRQTTCAAHFS